MRFCNFSWSTVQFIYFLESFQFLKTLSFKFIGGDTTQIFIVAIIYNQSQKFRDNSMKHKLLTHNINISSKTCLRLFVTGWSYRFINVFLIKKLFWTFLNLFFEPWLWNIFELWLWNFFELWLWNLLEPWLWNFFKPRLWKFFSLILRLSTAFCKFYSKFFEVLKIFPNVWQLLIVLTKVAWGRGCLLITQQF